MKKKQEKVIVKNNVKHYICVNNCENSGGDVAANCPVCKNPYIHNVAFHNDEFLKSGPLNVPKNNQNSQTENTTSAAQNSLGIYHYTCIKGCFGGSGTASNCTNCGTTLVHNQAFHTN